MGCDSQFDEVVVEQYVEEKVQDVIDKMDGKVTFSQLKNAKHKLLEKEKEYDKLYLEFQAAENRWQKISGEIGKVRNEFSTLLKRWSEQEEEL